jgi:hypothetical protein
VVYDRDHSSIACTAPDAYGWAAAFADASWLHTTDITAALSRHAFDSVLAAALPGEWCGEIFWT